MLSDGKVMLTYFALNSVEENKYVELIYFLIDKETLTKAGEINRIKISRADQNIGLMGYTVVDSCHHL